jgi:hypothetical protein
MGSETSGFFGEFGGRYSPEVLMPAILELEEVYFKVRSKKRFQKKWEQLQRDYIGRPSRLTYAARLIDPIAKTKLDDAGVKSKCGWTPYAGMNVNKIVFVVIGGQVVAQNFVE